MHHTPSIVGIVHNPQCLVFCSPALEFRRNDVMKSAARTAFAVLLLLSGTSSGSLGHAQVSTAVLMGTVLDSSGGAVPGAGVTLTSSRSGTSMSTITSAEGGYVFPQVPAGLYSLQVSLTGFRRFEQTGIVLNVSQKARVDVTLQIGQVTESVTVEGSAGLVNTVDGEVGQVVNQKNIVELPLKGRQFLELAFLSTGAVNAP